ncbi:MAG: M56 family metallopeptidase [Actinomycetota bacterium]|nr:M56 family metallopeptidase [Actinomycetota bacterium]
MFLKTFIYLFSILLIFKVFKIKDSQSFIFLLTLAMVKPFSSALKLKYNNYFISDNEIHYFFLEKIKVIFSYTSVNDRIIYLINMLLVYLFIAILIAGTLILIYQNFYYLKKLKCLENLHKCRNSEIISIVKKYSKAMKIRIPEIYFANGSNFGFFTIGLIKNIIILNGEIFNFLNKNEKETIILHELSHIKRKDNILNILLYYFNLMNFYNPITYLAYSLIKAEQEKDCDRIVLQYSQKTNKEVAKNILTSIIKIKNLSHDPGTFYPRTASFFSVSRKISEMTIRLRIKSLINTQKNETGISLFLKILLYLIFILLLLF